MRFNVKNLGFIKSGHFETNDLTVIFGKNNSGKTYLSYASYIIAKEIKENLNIFGSTGLDIEGTISKLGDTPSFDLNIETMFGDKHLSLIKTLVNSSFAKNFSVKNSYFSKTQIEFDFQSFVNKSISSSFSLMLSTRFVDNDVLITKSKGSNLINILLIKKTDSESDYLEKVNKDSLKSISHYFYNYQIPSAIIERIIDLDIKNPFVITSERTGIEMFYKEMDNNRSSIAESLTITTLVKKNKTRKAKEIDNITENKISKYSKPISDNIRTIRSQQEIRKNPSEISLNDNFPKLSESLKKITNGKFMTGILGDTVYLMDGHDSHEIPLHAASSSIKSMTMIDLYINHIASNGDTLIIDEPELNLHPDNQIIMAELIVRLVNSGVKVIMTTHSDYLVRELNNRIKLFSANKNNKFYKEMVSGEFDTIKSDRVNVFNINEAGIIEQIKVTKYGINDVIFDDVIIKSAEREDIIESMIED
ncbi:AAA family ATPase [Morganella morganii]|uniref:AAA family ATPase n=1 Tax=Morganella morganii TaxID=582 RepID=UPI0034D75ECB